jgi:O-antigen ligase
VNRLAALVVLGFVLAGLAIGFAVPMLGGSEYRSTATIVFTAVQIDDRPATASEARHITERLPSWARLAHSGAVASEFGVRGDETITARLISGSQSLLIELSASSQADLAGRATAAADAVIKVVTTAEIPRGAAASRVTGMVSEAGGEPVNMSLRWAVWGGLLGGVLGALAGWLVCALKKPGSWVSQLGSGGSRVAGAEAFAAEVDRELRALVAAVRTRRGALVIGLCFFAIAGYAATGSVGPPFLAMAGAAVVAFRDPRWIAVAMLGLSLSVLPAKLDLVKLGPVTPTVLEVSILVGVVALWRRSGRSVFTWPLVFVTAAIVLGCVQGFLGGAEFSELADALRSMILVPLGFVVVYKAFAGRLPQLVAIVVVGAAVASSIELVASVMDWQYLLVGERTSVITGADTAEVARLGAPVLQVWGPLLILLASGAFPIRPWRRLLLLALPGIAHEALSFNRSTWAPLLACIVLVAIARFGSKGLVKRLIAAAVLGLLALGLAGGGVFGSTGVALAERVTSVFSGEAVAEDSLADRVRENTAAVNTLLERPLLGTGVAMPYGGEIISYDAVHDRTVVESRPWIHNQYLRMWLWFGVLGLLAVGLLMVRVAAVVVHSWRLRAPGTVPVVAFGLGLACMATQSVFQTTLIDRAPLMTIALTLAMLGLAVSWQPQADEVGKMPLQARRIMTQ